MKIIKALVLLGICAMVLEFYRDWSVSSGDGRAADSNTIALPVAEDNAIEDGQIVDDETTEVTRPTDKDTGTLQVPAIDRIKSDAEQQDAIQRIDMTYTRNIYRA